MNSEILALRIALSNLSDAYQELSNAFCKNPDLNMFYRQARVLMKEYQHESSPRFKGKFGVPE